MRYCNLCHRIYYTERAYDSHNYSIHHFPKPPPPLSHFVHHPYLTARPCDEDGNELPPSAPPPQQDDEDDWWPFNNRPHFEFALWNFKRVQTSKDEVNELLRILAAQKAHETGDPDAYNMFRTSDGILETIDAIPHGELPWTTFHIRYTGPITPDTPAWKRQTYVIYTRNPLRVAEAMARSTDFFHTWDYRPYEEYTAPDCRRFANLMSGRWAYKKALAADPQMHGAMLTPVILGADKTTVSVMTGHQQYHPLYMSLGNIHNEMRHAHRDTVIPIAFLAIPKLGREKSTDEYRVFVKELYHAALAQILSPLRPGMTTPHVMRCPDGHLRRAVFELGPFIADYPEQVCLAGIVSGWCPKCLAYPHELETAGTPRFRDHTEALIDTLTPRELWDIFGVVAGVKPFTSYFPRADIHELLTPDLLHQLIKGTFKDHLVEWVLEYIRLTAETEDEAAQIIEQIDRRAYAAPPFPGLRRFPHGRNFSQWTGNDSKGLMKVFLASIAGFVPEKMSQCLAVFLDFGYTARRSAHDTLSLEAMQEALEYFHDLRTIFVDTGVRPTGFGLPRQHSLVHYILSIRQFGSPNGLCSSITESKHIEAVKETWRRSNWNEPTGQMIRTLSRLSKLSAAAIEFGRRGMLQNDVLTAAQLALGDETAEDTQAAKELSYLEAQDAQDLAPELAQPQLHEYVTRFVFQQLYPDLPIPADLDDDGMPPVPRRLKLGVHSCASAIFYAPTEISGPGGMHREIIRATPSWHGKFPHYDTVLVVVHPELQGMMRFRVARVRQFLSFTYDDDLYSCALVEWFITDEDGPDSATGMWIVRPEEVANEQVTSIIALSSIARACHLMPVLYRTFLPADFHFSETLDAFQAYYVNCYIDYHAHETIL
ncbi:hypothetical protein LXA43DRAFT_897215 [Ganoderma leucocontextum]|nr:hypothetical protein LXA43DRAFT_897215 [Ganoderma leucocontextum]